LLLFWSEVDWVWNPGDWNLGFAIVWVQGGWLSGN